MIVKDSRQKSLKRRYKKIFICALLLFVAVIILSNFTRGANFGLRSKRGLKVLRSGFIRQLVSKVLARPEHIAIDVKYSDFQKLAYKREEALSRKLLISDSTDYVPARIRYRGRMIPAQIRLKGDWINYLSGRKWSFRVKVRGDNTLWGMKRFSLHHPEARNFIYEWIFHKALKREGILSLRYKFIKLGLNGKDLGIYALEEHFRKELLEYNKRREGPIIKFNEDILWADRARRFGKLEPETAYYSSPIDGFKLKKTLDDEALKDRFIMATHLLESFRGGKLPAAKVFDIEKIAKYYALSDLLGAHHGLIYHNLRFYYNPVTSLLEPVAFDAVAGQVIKGLICNHEKYNQNALFDFGKTLFNDATFLSLYYKELERISEREYADGLFDSLGGEIDGALFILYSEFRKFIFYRDVLYKNQDYIKKALNPVKGLHAYFHEKNGERIVLKLGNIQPLPIEVKNLSIEDAAFLKPVSEVIISGKDPSRPVRYRKYSFIAPEEFSFPGEMPGKLKLHYRILGTGPVKSEYVYEWPYPDENFLDDDLMRQDVNAGAFECLEISESTKEIFIKQGTWDIAESLVIPAGYTVICDGGVRLNLLNSAGILSYSPCLFSGTEESPIFISSSDSTGQGLIVMRAGPKSLLRYVRFESLASPSGRKWELTGAVTFYESEVDISRCVFSNNTSEDSLNIIRSAFSIENTLFSDASSDAVDLDFSEGAITRCSFINCGNDAIDTSGSVVDIDNIVIENAKDKGLSIGENSTVVSSDIIIRDSVIAVACKDMSQATISGINFSDCRIGFAVYQKKAEFGPAAVKAAALDMDRVECPFLIEQGSSLSVDEKDIDSYVNNVGEML